MREFWAQTASFILAVFVHVLMAAIVVFGTMDWKPFRQPPALTGMNIEAVIVDTSKIKAAREQARREAEQLADFQAGMLEQVDATTAGVRLTADVIRRYREALEN